MKKLSSLEGRLGLFWVMGALSLTLGAWVLGHMDGLGPALIGYLLVLFSGLAWIGVSVGVTHKTKRGG